MTAKKLYLQKEVWKTYGYWAFWVGVAFFTIYPLCNYFTSTRGEVFKLFIDFELQIPFIAWFFWFYISLYLLFLLPPFFLNKEELVILGKRVIAGTILSGIIFLIIPTKLGFERVIPEGFYKPLFSNIFSLDLPHNMAPSLHIVYSAFILLAISQKSIYKKFFWLWLFLISISTLLVHQHHIIDIILAFLIIYIFTKLIK